MLKNHMAIFDDEITGAGFVQDASSIAGSVIMIIFIFKMPNGYYTRKKRIFNFWILVALMMISVVNFRLYFAPLEGKQSIYDLAVTLISGFFAGILVVSVLLKRKEYIPIYRNRVVSK
jgi:membrane-associated HD superfamily phosphohydrolase